MWLPTKDGMALTEREDLTPAQLNQINSSITKHEGFYVARYEASKDGTKASSQKGKSVWNNVNYTDSKKAAEAVATYYGYTTVTATLISGKAWDTMVEWIEKANYNVTNSTAWGNYSNSKGGGSLKTTGSSNTWRAKNIYDVAGNVMEWTTEVNTSISCFNRGGSFYFTA